MDPHNSLHLYEQITLLALREEAGTIIGSGTYPQTVAGAILAELLLEGRIRVEDPKKKLVDVVDNTPLGDPLLDEALMRIATAKRRTRLRCWVSRLSTTRGLKPRAVAGLCRRGILRVEEDQILLVFRRKIYPERDPRPEREIVSRLRKAIFGDSRQVDPSTSVLVALAHAAGLLGAHFPRGELRARGARIKQIARGEAAGQATKEAIQAMQAAAIVAVVVSGGAMGGR